MFMKQTFVVFCPNQISLTVAVGLAEQVGPHQRVIAVYWPLRCTPVQRTLSNLTLAPYSRLKCCLVWLRARGRGQTVAVIPHQKLGRFVNIFASTCTRVALVDDGLDTWREKPKNVEPGNFADETDFYTFRYSERLGSWLSRFRIHRVADLKSIGLSNRPLIDLTDTDRIIVESPPLGQVAGKLPLDDTRTTVVTHSNPNKRTFDTNGRRAIDGAKVALEASLDEFCGEVVVGESMVAVYAIAPLKAEYRLTVYLDKDQVANLAAFVSLMNSREFCSLELC